MKTLALTGGIASGKSTVGEFFETCGAVVIKADPIAHQIYDPGTPLFDNLLKRYGKKILGSDGTIQRRELGKLIFSSSEEKQWLEAQTHGPTREIIQKQITQAGASNPPLILVEAAIHIESGYYRDFEGLIVVDVSPQVQLERLVKDVGLSKAEAEQRIQNQLPLAEKRELADWVIDNSGTLDETRDQVALLFEKLTGIPCGS